MSETNTPIEIKLGDGSVVKGDNIEEAFKNALKMKEDTAAALKEQREQYAQLEQRFNSVQQQVTEMVKPKVEPGGFSKEKYYELLNNDPVAANDYYFEFRFGRKPEDFNNEYTHNSQVISRINQESVAASFMAQHADDFPAGDRAAVKAFRAETERLLGQGMQFNVDTLDYAYTSLVKRGDIKPLEALKDDTQNANPSMSGRGSGEEDYSAAHKMTDAELEAALRKAGALV